jgi:hypothetical protein
VHTSRLFTICLLMAASRDASAAAAGIPPANPCDVVTAANVASILTAPATRKPGVDAASCMYQTQSHAIVRISIARGDDEKGAWMLATTYNATKTPLAGVADEALYNPDGTTLIARKGDTSVALTWWATTTPTRWATSPRIAAKRSHASSARCARSSLRRIEEQRGDAVIHSVSYKKSWSRRRWLDPRKAGPANHGRSFT